jgi:hypothetical protein
MVYLKSSKANCVPNQVNEVQTLLRFTHSLIIKFKVSHEKALNGAKILQFKQVYIQYKMCYMHNTLICTTTEMSNLPSKANVHLHFKRYNNGFHMAFVFWVSFLVPLYM